MSISLETYALAKKNASKGLAEVIRNGSTAEWATKDDEISENGAIYIYKDFAQTTDGVTGDTVYHPNIKIGDGVTTIGNLKFITESTAYQRSADIFDAMQSFVDGLYLIFGTLSE